MTTPLLPGMFSEAPAALVVPASPALAPVERRRLSGQNAAILARLQRGSASNHELSALSLKYTSRISDLRAAGYDVRVIERDRATGKTWYALSVADLPHLTGPRDGA